MSENHGSTSFSVEPMVAAWKLAAKELSFSIEAPFFLFVGNRRFSVVGFLPDFGSANGMILDMWVPGQTELTRELHNAATRDGRFCSCVSPEVYSRFDKKVFLEALNDWG